jgi:hypothetical protein
LFKQRKPKRFNYKPRYSKSDGASTSEEEDSRKSEFVSKWQSLRETTQRKGFKLFSLPILVLILVLLLICMYVLEIKFMTN